MSLLNLVVSSTKAYSGNSRLENLLPEMLRMVVSNLGQQGILSFKLVSKATYAAAKKSDGTDVVSLDGMNKEDFGQAMHIIEKGWHRPQLQQLSCASGCGKLKPRSAFPDSQRANAVLNRSCLSCGTASQDADVVREAWRW